MDLANFQSENGFSPRQSLIGGVCDAPSRIGNAPKSVTTINADRAMIVRNVDVAIPAGVLETHPFQRQYRLLAHMSLAMSQQASASILTAKEECTKLRVLQCLLKTCLQMLECKTLSHRMGMTMIWERMLFQLPSCLTRYHVKLPFVGGLIM